MKTETTFGTQPEGTTVLLRTTQDGYPPAPLPRWALTSDGALVDLGTPGAPEIPKERARALVDFIRTLHQVEA